MNSIGRGIVIESELKTPLFRLPRLVFKVKGTAFSEILLRRSKAEAIFKSSRVVQENWIRFGAVVDWLP